ncbi:alpha/beta hydrolase [Amycolatopsis rubida]|uniref:Alpha/beta hydrolase n=1 Tax=Amycolatopsis rubida TaxID=112413 RepID=A0A1I6ARY5_9PSEU|nr:MULTISPECIES: alpha/beta hydrolase [Amycolatopsis]MYW89717.1 alpha/beta fold hydrolase [Amycolatopsis rubida]NEC54693.1 alpha/beta hydrolase [Amycolatopsis rubida]OAP24375.1 N-formylmaleamate deformylase [Amycolatopsis sp. M39]SFQ71478.1 N-formylmaleamate deformylase [Amycolatopsis rubida]
MSSLPDRVLSQSALADLADVPAASVWARSGSVRLHVLDYGPADGVPLVVLPGITSPAITMDFVARELTDLVRPLVLDVRGRGLSDDGPGYGLDAYAADVEAVIDQLNLSAPLLFGHSMGARIAAKAALSGRVAGTVLADPPMSGPGRRYPTSLAVFESQVDQARRGTNADEVAASWPRWPRREQELRARWLASCSRAAIAATHAGFESEEFLPLWENLPGPAVLLHGAESPVVTSADVAVLEKSKHPLAAVAGAGHMIFWDEPQPARHALRSALKDVLAR